MMMAEVHGDGGRVRWLRVERPPEHVYCDTCGDCLVCSPHGKEDWCPTGGRWVLYVGDPEDDATIAAADAANAEGPQRPGKE